MLYKFEKGYSTNRNNLFTPRNLQNQLSGNSLLIYTLFITLAKSLLFLGVIATDKATKIDFTRAFFGKPHLIVYICFTLVFLSFSFLFRGKGQLIYMILFNVVFAIFLIADLWYYRGFNNFITVHNLSQTGNLDNLLSDVLSMMRPVDLLFIADFPLLLFIVFIFKGSYSRKKRSFSAFFGIILLSVSYISIIHYKVDIVEKGQNTILFRICWTPNQTMANLSPLGYHIYDVYNYWSESQPYHLTTAEREEIDQWFADKKEVLEPNSYKGLLKGKNLIVIQVESLEKFIINEKIEGQEISPNLNKLLKNSLFFTNYHEQVYNGTSSDADLLTNTSVYPVRRGSTFFRYPYNTYNSLPKLLEKQGYTTTAIHPDKGSYWNWMPALKSIGFQNTIDSASFNMDETIGLGLSDGSYLRQVEPIIQKEKAPFYTFLVTLTSHGPFDLPEDYRELKLSEELDKTKMGGYFQSIHYVDKHIGILMDKLEKSGVLDNSVVVVYGDHTGIHKYYEDEVKKMPHQEDWWENNNWRIPLIIYSKNLTGEEIKNIGGQVDLLPTLAYLMGIEDNEYNTTAMGRNLLNTKKNYTVLSSGKFIGSKTDDKEEEKAVRGLELADKIIRSDYFKK